MLQRTLSGIQRRGTHGKNQSVSEEEENETKINRRYPSGLTFTAEEGKSMIQCADSGLTNGPVKEIMITREYLACELP